MLRLLGLPQVSRFPRATVTLHLDCFQLLFHDWRGYIIGGFALVWVANLYMNLYANFRLDIKKERVEIKQIEKQVKEPEPPKPKIERPAA